MRVAVLGSGNGGCAVAFDFAAHGYEVSLFDFDTFPTGIAAIRAQGGIHATGQLDGFAPVAYAGHDLATALQGAALIFAVGPAYSTDPFAAACRPHLLPGQTVVVCPGSCMGSVAFKQAAGLDLEDDRIIVAETSTLPYAVRLLEPGRIHVFLKLRAGLFMAALPAQKTMTAVEQVRAVYPAMTPADTVLQTTLQNGNPVIHPAVSLLNAALIERTAGDFYFYEEGVTPAVGRLIRSVDLERIALGKALGLTIIAEPELGRIQGYMSTATYDQGYAEAPGFRGIRAQSSLAYRYFHEDVGYGLVFLQSLGNQIGVPTPTISAIIQLTAQLMERDYAGEARRTMAALGLAGYSVADLRRLLG